MSLDAQWTTIISDLRGRAPRVATICWHTQWAQPTQAPLRQGSVFPQERVVSLWEMER